MKLIYITFCLLVCSCTYHDMERIFKDRPDAYTKFLGEMDYSKSQREAANHKLGVDFKRPIHETKDKKKMYYVGGNVYHNYDVFNKSYYVNGFGHVGVEF